MLMIALVPIVQGSESGDGAGTTTSVVYHMYMGKKPSIDTVCNGDVLSSGDSIPSVTVEYAGVVSTEYNPQKWSGTIKGRMTSGEYQDWFPITSYETGRTIVFTGWVYKKVDGTEVSYVGQDGIGRYPGEVIDPKQYSGNDGKIHVYATWGLLANHSLAGSYLDSASINSWKDSGNVFTNILELNAGSYTLSGGFGKPLTITGKGEGTSVTLDVKASLSDACIIDSLAIRNTKETGGNHGYGTNVGLYANGNDLVLGTGLTASLPSTADKPVQYLLQVFGGSIDGGVDRTNVIIHSGYYYTLVAGGQNGSVSKDTRLTIRGGTVIDTVVGGCSAGGKVGGDTHVYLLGDAVMPGDYYEEKSLYGDYSLNIGREVQSVESSILTGGSNKSEVGGNTYVHISNNATAWDVQGAGRGGQSTVKGTANVFVSGNALIKHVVNGSITDGLNGNPNDGSSTRANQCVKNTNIVISDKATVASVFGAGYDTFYASKYSSMYHGGTISITIEGGTVGYVYGGGYRGTIGIQSNSSSATPEPLDSITIDIRGGIVLYDVFGGGRGGLDKICHGSDGSFNWGSSQNDTVGHSRVYAKSISISVGAGAQVNGSVYGGGESTPVITSYDGVGVLDSKSLGGSSDSKVAYVECESIAIDIKGTVAGSVYGAGKGIDLDDEVDGRHSTAYIFAMDSKGDMKRIPWIGNGTGASTTYHSSSFGDFASVQSGTITVNAGGNIGGSVYGGGAYSTTAAGTITVNMNGGEAANLYGGGLGSTGSLSTKAGRKVSVTGGTVRGSVYGSSSLGDDGDSKNPYDVTIKITGGEIRGSVYGGGYKGAMHGDVSISLGGSARIMESVYGGADIGTASGDGSEWNTILVHGKTSIAIDGSGRGFHIGRSIFGSGNSCLVDGDKTVTIRNFTSDESFESLQNIDVLAISGSDITLTGRVDGTSAQASSKYSLSNVGSLSLLDGTDLDLEAAINNLGSYGSYVTSGDALSPTTESSPMNSVRLSDGVVFEVKTVGDSGAVYGKVEGYTKLSLHVSEQYYGAFAYGSKDSFNAGFMVLGNGTLIRASTTAFDDCFCWYIAGAVRYTTTVVAYADSGASGKQTVYAVLPKMSSSTSIVYVGHSTYEAMPGSLNLVDTLSGPSDFRLTMGGAGGNMIFDEDGVPITGDHMSVDPVRGIPTAGGDSSIPRIAYELEFLGQVRTGYLGSVHFSYWEAVPANSNDLGSGYILQNRIDVELEIYAESPGADFAPSAGQYTECGVTIHTVGGEGISEFVIPRSFHDYEVVLDRAEGAVAGRMTVTPVYNEERTLGWAQPMQGEIVPGANVYVGQLKGSFHATLDIRVSGAGTGDAKLYFTMRSGDDVRTFCLNVHVVPSVSYNVTFVDDVRNPGGSTVISVIAGGTISNALVPLTGENFIGWFLDSGYNRLFNFNTPITHDIVLHALYRYAVTFDLMNGQRFVDYVDMSNSTAISHPANPSWDGYEFQGWLKDSPEGRVRAFADGSEVIRGDTTFYADWKGRSVTITYVLRLDGMDEVTIGTSDRNFGSIYGDDLKRCTKDVVEKLKGTKYKFVRWVDESGNFAYSDTELYHSADHVLYTECTDYALEVRLSAEFDDGRFFDVPVINAPVNFLVYENKGRFAFIPSNATTTGYYLSGWSFSIGERSFSVPAGAEIAFTKSGDDGFVYVEDGSQHIHRGLLTLSAMWEPLLYEVGIQEPIGGTVKCDAEDLSKLKYNQTIGFEYVPNPALPYTLESWVVSGECSYSVSGNTMTLTVHGNCYVSVRLGGMYDVSVVLNVDGSPDAQDRDLTLVSSSGDHRSLKWENGRYAHSAVPAGAYSLVMGDGTVLDERLNVLSTTSRTYDLYTINVVCTPSDLSGLLTYPRLAVAERTVEVLFDKGYDADATSPDVSLMKGQDRISFTMPSVPVRISISLEMKTIMVSLDYEEGTDGSGSSTGSITVGYNGKYDFSSLGVSKTGHELMHWADSQGRQYKTGDPVDPDVDSLTAVWKAKDGVEYKVVLRYQSLDPTVYDKEETLTYYGTWGDVIDYTPPDRTGFKTPGSKKITIGSGTDPTVFDYERRVYDVKVTGTGVEEVTKSMVYGAPLSEGDVQMKTGYAFRGWFSDAAMTVPVATVPAFEGECVLYVKTEPKTYTILYRDGITGHIIGDVSSLYVYGRDSVVLKDVHLVKDGFIVSGFLYGDQSITEIDSSFIDSHPDSSEIIITVVWIPVVVKVTVYAPADGEIYSGDETLAFTEGVCVIVLDYGSDLTLEYKDDGNTLYAWMMGGTVVYGDSPLVIKRLTDDIVVAPVVKLVANDVPNYSYVWSVVEGNGTITGDRIEYRYDKVVPLGDCTLSSPDGVVVKVSDGVLSVVCDRTATGTILMPRLMPSDASFILSVTLCIVGKIADAEVR